MSHLYLVVEGFEEYSTATLVETGLSRTKYVAQLLASFDVEYTDFEHAATDSNECYLLIKQ